MIEIIFCRGDPARHFESYQVIQEFRSFGKDYTVRHVDGPSNKNPGVKIGREFYSLEDLRNRPDDVRNALGKNQ